MFWVSRSLTRQHTTYALLAPLCATTVFCQRLAFEGTRNPLDPAIQFSGAVSWARNSGSVVCGERAGRLWARVLPSLLKGTGFLEVIFPQTIPDSFFACNIFSTSVFCCTVTFLYATQLPIRSDFFVVVKWFIYKINYYLEIGRHFFSSMVTLFGFARDVCMCRDLWSQLYFLHLELNCMLRLNNSSYFSDY